MQWFIILLTLLSWSTQLKIKVSHTNSNTTSVRDYHLDL